MTRDLIIEKFRVNYMDIARRRADAAVELAIAEVDVVYMDALRPPADNAKVVRVAMRKAAAMIDYEAVRAEVDATVGRLRAELLRAGNG
jgi:hypothetical protein